MKKLIFIVALIVGIADTASAETWLCIDKAEAGVSITEPFESSRGIIRDFKQEIIVDEKTNQVKFKNINFEGDKITCDNSSSGLWCHFTTGVGFTFSLDKIARSFVQFSIVAVKTDGADAQWATVNSGKCLTI